MKYLDKTFSIYPSVEQKPVKKAGRKTFIYCKDCDKVHEVGSHGKTKKAC